jgi:hypothetical protein
MSASATLRLSVSGAKVTVFQREFVMIKYMAFWGLLVLTGCTSVEEGVYIPQSSKERAAFVRASTDLQPNDIRNDFQSMRAREVAWVGVIEDIQYRETERTVQVAFRVDHRYFDWKDHGSSHPYHLSKEGEGIFMAGWVVKKPTRISYLRTLAKPGDMLVVYGKPYGMKNNIIQLAATAIRPITDDDYSIVEEEPEVVE